ncbi:anti-sigma factor [Paenibacillus sanguinis]|uniref:anti-sigma factor n=1 Tax=Paenibacillus sanguinis TaxID=225906 RepID=UPI000372350A|nr:anti-sigma factor [Paenibacillus sanguinis]
MNGYTGVEWKRRKQDQRQEEPWRMQEACMCGFAEQEWVDWLLGSLSESKRAQMAEHLDSCAVCLEHKQRWENILRPDTEDKAELFSGLSAGQAAPSGFPSIMQEQGAKESLALPLTVSAEDAAASLPSERIRRSLRRKVRVIGLQRKGRHMLDQLVLHRRWLIPFAAAIMIFIGLGLGMSRVNEPSLQWNRYVEAYEPEALPVMSKPDSLSYPIAWGRMQPESGMVWYNAASGEMLMLVGGLVPEKDQTVRVWLVREGTRDSLGLLQYHANRAHLYVKDRPLTLTDALELTIEPPGSGLEPSAAPHVISLDILGR